MKGLTVNEECKVGHPYTSRNRHDELLPIPNSDAGRNHELNFASGRRWYHPRCRRRRTCGVLSRRKRQQWLGTQRAKKEREREREESEVPQNIKHPDLVHRETCSRIGRCPRPGYRGHVRAQVHIRQTVVTTYLAVVVSRCIRTDQAKYYGHKSGHTRSRVHLQNDADRVTGPGSKCVRVRTIIVQRYGRRPRMTLHS
jgi:hypothetical protein